MEPSAQEITQLLRAWSGGDQAALEKLTPLVYAELHRAAHRYMSQERPAHTLQTTALINELYLPAGRCARGNVARSRSFFWHLRAADAACIDRLRSLPWVPQERRRFAPRGLG